MKISRLIFLPGLAAGIGIVLLLNPLKAASTGEQPIVLLRPTPTAPKESINLDGSKKLTLKTQRQTDGTTTSIVTASNRDGTDEKTLLTKTLASGASLELHNSWAPADAYVFVEERSNGSQRFLVLKSSGEPFAKGEEYLDITALFAARETGYAFRDATGWASETLLIIRTSKEDGTNGPSFWFEVPSRAFIQLAR